MELATGQRFAYGRRRYQSRQSDDCAEYRRQTRTRDHQHHLLGGRERRDQLQRRLLDSGDHRIRRKPDGDGAIYG